MLFRSVRKIADRVPRGGGEVAGGGIDERVVSTAAGEDARTTAPGDLVRARAAVDRVGARIAGQGIGKGRPGQGALPGTLILPSPWYE